jgi:hypothetical protein
MANTTTQNLTPAKLPGSGRSGEIVKAGIANLEGANIRDSLKHIA